MFGRRRLSTLGGRALIGVVTSTIGLATPAAAAGFTRTDLGVLPGMDFSLASDVNASGTVVGSSSSFNAPARAVRWNEARAIKNGVIVGTSGSGSGSSFGHALKWTR
jgi:uncharacterized membrane protein